MTDLEQVAKRLFWWKEPAEALADSNRFLAQHFRLGLEAPDALPKRQLPAD